MRLVVTPRRRVVIALHLHGTNEPISREARQFPPGIAKTSARSPTLDMRSAASRAARSRGVQSIIVFPLSLQGFRLLMI
jgi:hypothetical protein